MFGFHTFGAVDCYLERHSLRKKLKIGMFLFHKNGQGPDTIEHNGVHEMRKQYRRMQPRKSVERTGSSSHSSLVQREKPTWVTSQFSHGHSTHYRWRIIRVYEKKMSLGKRGIVKWQSKQYNFLQMIPNKNLKKWSVNRLCRYGGCCALLRGVSTFVDLAD